MKAFQSVPIPALMKNLPKDKRGYPIPHTVITKDGVAHFTVNDEARRQRSIAEDKCPICNRKLFRFRASIGGPLSALHPHGAFIDPPMHVECAQYALQVCPYLALPSYIKRIDAGTLKDEIITIDQTMDPRKPDLFLMVVHRDQRYVFWDGTMLVRYIKPTKPYVRIEYWNHSKQIPNDEGEQIARAVLQKQLEADYEHLLKEAEATEG